MNILDPIFYRTLFYDFRPVISPGLRYVLDISISGSITKKYCHTTCQCHTMYVCFMSLIWFQYEAKIAQECHELYVALQQYCLDHVEIDQIFEVLA
jgi:hypothetical protein